MLYSGLDLHKRTLFLSTVTAEGRPVRDAKLPTTREAVLLWEVAVFATSAGGLWCWYRTSGFGFRQQRRQAP